MKKNRDGILICVGILTALIPTVLLFIFVTYLFFATLVAGLVAALLGFTEPTRVKRITGIFVCVLSIVGSIGLLVYASTSGQAIQLVIPNDYSGEIRIHLDKENGIPPEKTKDYWIYKISDEGTLLTSNTKPFGRWHQTRAEFRDGRVIIDDSSENIQTIGYRLESRGTSITGNDSNPSYHWNLMRVDGKKAEDSTR